MEIILNKYLYKDKEINLTIKHNSVIGITGSNFQDFLSLISLHYLSKGSYYLNDNKVTKENIKVFRKRIAYIEENLSLIPFLTTVQDYLIYEIKRKNLTFKNISKKLVDSLKIVGLSKNYLERNVVTLSSSEKKLLQFSLILLSNPTIIILDEPFKTIDLKNEKKLMNLLLKLKEQYQKTIIIGSTNATLLYKYTTEMIFLSDNTIYLQGPTTKTYLEVDKLKKNKFVIPPIVEFTYLAKKKKNIKLDYHKDIRDIIKDIYKHI